MIAQEHAAEPVQAAESENPLEHIVQHPLIERPASWGPLTPNGRITVFSDQIAMIALAGVLLIALVPALVRKRRGASGVDAMVPAGSANAIEALMLEAAEAVIDVSAWPSAPWPMDIVQSLMEKSLVRAPEDETGTPRFALYASIRAYADEKMGDPAAVLTPEGSPATGPQARAALHARAGGHGDRRLALAGWYQGERAVREHGLTPLARFVGFASRGVPPEIMGIGPIEAIPAALKSAGLKLDDIGWIELNEAFAAQSLAVLNDLDSKGIELDRAKVNPNGGAIALGHPIGCSGAFIATKAIYELHRTGGDRKSTRLNSSHRT